MVSSSGSSYNLGTSFKLVPTYPRLEFVSSCLEVSQLLVNFLACLPERRRAERLLYREMGEITVSALASCLSSVVSLTSVYPQSLYRAVRALTIGAGQPSCRQALEPEGNVSVFGSKTHVCF